MPTMTVAVPDIGGFNDVPIIEVLVAPGDTIAKDAPLVTLESDKATMEVPSTLAGVVRAVNVKIGDKVSQGTTLVSVEVAEAVATESQAAPVTQAPVAAPPVAAPAAFQGGGVPVVAPLPQAPTDVPRNGTSANGSTHSVTEATTHDAIVHASPAIRRFARQLGVDLQRVHGSGPNARITRDDVQAFVKQTITAPAQAAAGSGATLGGLSIAPWPTIDFAKFGPIERVPLSRIKKLSGSYLARNWVMIPHVTQHDDADVTELEAFRQSINADQTDVKVTMLALLMKACIAALRAFPDVNSSLDGDDLVRKQYYHLGFAADTPAGLVVPVIRDVDTKGILDLARESSELAKKAREGKLTPAEMSGATFTISSLGGIGGTYFTPIINAPEVAILGVCRTAVRPVWNGTAFEPRTILPLSFSYDHRVIDGAAAARFVTYLSRVLRDLRRSLL